MNRSRPTALVAEDEPLLRQALIRHLARAWPELEIVAEARNGPEAVRLFDTHHPDLCFLDIRMPCADGIHVACHIGRRAHVVFVTAYDDYAVQAFAHGALDYLVKPIEPARLADTVTRLQARLSTDQPVREIATLLQQLGRQLAPRQDAAPAPLRWLHAQSGQALRLIPVQSIDYLRADAKYTHVAWRDETGQPREAMVSLTLKALREQLDRQQFVQVHRAVLVNLQSVSHVIRDDHDTARLHLRGRSETLPVSRSHLPLFKAM